jgi:hypothetical protein
VKPVLILYFSALIMVSATPGYFFQPGKNSLWLKQLAGLPKTPWRDLLVTSVGPNRELRPVFRLPNLGLYHFELLKKGEEK